MAAPTEEGNSTLVGSVGTSSVPWPTHQADDIGILVVATANELISTPSGWTDADTPTSGDRTGTGGGTTSLALQWFWKRATSSSEANASLEDAGNHTAAYIFVIRGTETSGNPWDAFSAYTLDLDGSNGVNAASVATQGADRLLVLFGASAADRALDRVAANHADWTKEYSLGTNLGNGSCLAHFTAPAATQGTYGAWTSAITWTDALPAITKVIAFKPGAGDQNLTGTLFTKAPTFPQGAVVPGDVTLTGTTFTRAPTFPQGAVAQGGADQNLTGTTFTRAPTFPQGALQSVYTLTGTLFSTAPTFPQGSVTPGAVTLTGTTFTRAPTFPQGSVSQAGAPQDLTGTTFTRAPTFPQGAVTAVYTLAGVTFTRAPTFPQGAVTPGAVTLTGVLFTRAPTFPQGAVTQGAGTQDLTGTTFTRAPSFPTGAVTSVYTLTGVTFTRAPSFPVGQLTWVQTIAGVTFTRAPTFPLGQVSTGNLGEPVPYPIARDLGIPGQARDVYGEGKAVDVT